MQLIKRRSQRSYYLIAGNREIPENSNNTITKDRIERENRYRISNNTIAILFYTGTLAVAYEQFSERIEQMLKSVEDCGWGFPDTLYDIYYEYKFN